MIVLHAHVNNSFTEVQVIIHLVEAIVDANFILLVKSGLDMCP